jgi:DNA-directed RNA polymerase sigma subunit (sigma70/sigma32)
MTGEQEQLSIRAAAELENLRQRLARQMGREPTIDELATRSGRPPAEVCHLTEIMQRPMTFRAADLHR